MTTRTINKARSAFLIMEVFVKKFLIILMLITCVIISHTACGVNKDGGSNGTTKDPVSKEGFFFDTICTISIYDMDDMSQAKAEKLLEYAYKEAERYEKIFSRQIEGSDLWTLNNKGFIEMSAEAIKPLEAGIKYGDLSHGAFDITMGSVLDLWDFHKDSGTGNLPDESELKKRLETVGYKDVSIEKNKDGSGKITIAKPGQIIDLGGVAKGYICDEISGFLKKHGVKSAIVNLGGNITVIGKKPNGEAFKVGIEKPYSDRKDIIGAVDMNNQTIVTSGIYERYVEVDGKKYHHILDPNTGWPIDTDVVSVTVVSKFGNSMECDAMSTTLLLLGSEKGMKLVEKNKDMEALFQLKNGDMINTSGFKYEKR